MFWFRTPPLDMKNIPCHVAIIMDGNGRWAERRGLPRSAGHRAGLSAVRTVLQEAARLKVKYLTLYAFSTENWQRPKAEVDFLMSLPEEFWRLERGLLDEHDVRFNVLGDLAALPDATRQVVLEAMSVTQNCQTMTLNLAFNYGARAELFRAARLYAQNFPEDGGTEVDFSQGLYTAGMPDPDLLIRSGGEKRLSNFLLWQAAYSEIVFSDVSWPDFTATHFRGAILEYQKRRRRRGGLASREGRP